MSKFETLRVRFNTAKVEDHTVHWLVQDKIQNTILLLMDEINGKFQRPPERKLDTSSHKTNFYLEVRLWKTVDRLAAYNLVMDQVNYLNTMLDRLGVVVTVEHRNRRHVHFALANHGIAVSKFVCQSEWNPKLADGKRATDTFYKGMPITKITLIGVEPEIHKFTSFMRNRIRHWPVTVNDTLETAFTAGKAGTYSKGNLMDSFPHMLMAIEVKNGDVIATHILHQSYLKKVDDINDYLEPYPADLFINPAHSSPYFTPEHTIVFS